MTQADRILERLKRSPATTLELILDCGTVSPTKRISELRRDGHIIISTERKERGKRIVTYYLSEQAELEAT